MPNGARSLARYFLVGLNGSSAVFYLIASVFFIKNEIRPFIDCKENILKRQNLMTLGGATHSHSPRIRFTFV
jgi:hypothetical protein